MKIFNKGISIKKAKNKVVYKIFPDKIIMYLKYIKKLDIVIRRTYRIFLQLDTGFRQGSKPEGLSKEVPLPLNPAAQGIVQLDEELPGL